MLDGKRASANILIFLIDKANLATFLMRVQQEDAMEEYRVRIRGVEVFVDSLDALDKIIERYAGQVTSEVNGSGSIPKQESQHSNDPVSGTALDRALLKRFIEVGQAGIPSKELAMKLHANRKAVQIGLRKWAERIGVWHGNFAAIFEKNLKDGSRGYRLTREAISAGNDVLGVK